MDQRNTTYWAQRIYHDLAGTTLDYADRRSLVYWLQRIYLELTGVNLLGDQRSVEYWSEAIYNHLAGLSTIRGTRSAAYWWQRIYAVRAGTTWPDGSDGRSLGYWLQQAQAIGLESSTTPSTLLNGLVAAWKLGEASGARADDLGTYNLSPTNNPGSAVGKIGNAIQFVAVSTQYLSLTANALGFGTSSFTLGLWIYLDSNPTQLWIGHGNGGGAGYSWALQYVTPAVDRLDFYVGDNLGASQVVRANNLGAVPLSTWLAIMAWKDIANSQIAIQVNGGTPDTAVFAPNSGALPGEITIGTFPSLHIQPCDGRADACALWSRVLTSAERTEWYNGGAGKEYPFT